VGLSPAISVAMAAALLGESASPRVWTGIVLALVAVPLLSYQPPGNTAVKGRLWLWLSLAVCFAWGIQAYVLRFANQTMKSESIFFYMTVTAVALAPLALWMTDFRKPIHWGPSGPLLAAAVQSLNSIGALTMVYAFRYGQAIVVSPLINAVAPAITVLLSLLLYRTVPHRVVALGIALAAVAFYLMS